MPDLDPEQPVDYGTQEVQRIAGKAAAGGYDRELQNLDGGITKALGKVLAFAFSILDSLIILAVRAIGKLLGQLDPAFGALASAVVGQMFDVEVNTNAFTNLTDHTDRKKLAEQVGDSLLAAFKGDQANAGAGELEPSTLGAQQYLGVMTNMAIEGWVFDVFGGFVPFLHLHHIGDLKDSMARVLGLGRMSRAVLRPFVNTLISRPAQWSVNKQYRPTMLSVPQAIAAWFRGDITEETMREIAARDGYGDDAIEALVHSERKHLSPADIDLLGREGTLTYGDQIAAFRSLNFDEQGAIDAINLEESKHYRAWKLAQAGNLVAAYGDRRITDRQFADRLALLALDPSTLGRVQQDAANRRANNVAHMTRGDVEAAVKHNILNITDYHDWLEARGYSLEDALTLELLLTKELEQLEAAEKTRAAAAARRAAELEARNQAAAAKREQLAAEHAAWSGTLGQAERLVVRDIMPPAQYRQILVAHGVTPADADQLVLVATQDRDNRRAQLAKRAAGATTNKPAALALATITRAALLGARSLDDVRAFMQARDYSAADIALEIDLLAKEITDRQAAAAVRAANAGKVSTPTLTLGQLERAVLDGVQTVEQYGAVLAARGLSPIDVGVLVADMRARLEIRAFADARRQLAVERLEASHLSLAQEEKAVVDGIQTIDDYAAYLAAHGFDASDQAILVALLEQKLG